MSIFAIKNDEGKWLGWEVYCDEPDWFERGGFMWDTRSVAEENVNLYGGHVVELTEAPAKIVVSEEEAKMLKKAKNTTVWRPASVIAGYAYGNTKDPDNEALLEDRLMRAYVVGWVVEKTKRWNVKVPHAEKTLYRKHDSGALFASIYVGQQNHANDFLFTDSEIIKYGLQDCERVEVTDDEQ